jgi:hypothetical protein
MEELGEMRAVLSDHVSHVHGGTGSVGLLAFHHRVLLVEARLRTYVAAGVRPEELVGHLMGDGQ